MILRNFIQLKSLKLKQIHLSTILYIYRLYYNLCRKPCQLTALLLIKKSDNCSIISGTDLLFGLLKYDPLNDFNLSFNCKFKNDYLQI